MATTATTAAPELVLLFDGVCAFCHATVQTVLRHDRTGTMRFATLQGEHARAIVERHPELRGIDSVVLVERSADGRERVFTRSDAALRVARYLGGRWRLALAGYAVPRPLRDLAYRLVAWVRHRVFGKYDTCPIPTPAERARFLDFGGP